MKPLFFPFPGNEAYSEGLRGSLEAETGRLTLHRFPDGESYLRFETEVRDREVVLVCTLDHPDQKLIPLLMAAATARDLGARRVGLVAPYLAYLRQDCRFHPGESVTSVYVARLLSTSFGWLVTMDPHLHRYASLGEIYAIPTEVVAAAPALSAWLKTEVSDGVLIGPDAESAQWVRAVAAGAGLPHVVLEKVRRGDRDVSVSVPDLARWPGRTPVLVDDIISTGHTMIAAVRHLVRSGLKPPVCLAVHGIFAGEAHAELLAAGAVRIVTTDSIPHATNAIPTAGLLAKVLRTRVQESVR